MYTEMIPGGELALLVAWGNHLKKLQVSADAEHNEALDESDVRDLIAYIIAIVSQIHAKNIAYRDAKVENFLLNSLGRPQV